MTRTLSNDVEKYNGGYQMKINFSKTNNIRKMLLSAMFLSLGILLPFLTGQIKEIGDTLLPMQKTRGRFKDKGTVLMSKDKGTVPASC